MGIFFRDDDDNNEEEYTGQTGDPIHDAIYGWDLGSGSSSDDDHIEETGGGPAIDFAERNSYAKKAWQKRHGTIIWTSKRRKPFII